MESAQGEAREAPRVTVVVSVYGALEKVEACIESLRAHAPAPHRVLLIDDHSPDPRVWRRLQDHAGSADRTATIRHPKNLGYTATINHGCRLAARDDVVLLNSDTEVTPRWLEKLIAAAGSAENVATVTPLSNAAGAFSVPRNHRVNCLPSGVSAAEMAQVVERLSDRLYPRVPTGNGFCLYIRREALDAVGPFDELAFPAGCGEENDFCMRATGLGYIHLIDDTTYIHHHRSASLGRRKRWLLLRSSWKLRRRHPDYQGRVAAWLAADPIDPLRERLQKHFADGSEVSGPPAAAPRR